MKSKSHKFSNWIFSVSKNSLVFFTQHIHKLIFYFEKKLRTEADDTYSSLTPTTRCDENNVYENSLLWAIKNDEINNIAITGAYGSGKSSVILKFQKNHPEYRFLNISLACFNTDNTPVKEDVELLEMSILQQISHFVKHKSIPDSKLSRIHKYSNIKLFVWSILIILWLLSTLFISFRHTPIYSEIRNVFLNFEIINDNKYVLKWIPYLYQFIFIFLIIRKSMRNLLNINFTKFKFQGNEIELSKENTPSILNKYLDEIMYFFEVNPFDIVIIEDLDRFELVDIFSKLREINQIINRSKRIKNKVKFLYAIKDDLFKKQLDRTKFFDFILPIVPVINVTNSGDILLQKRTDHNILDLSDSFILNAALYIDDMRLLNNIFNEFLIYKVNLYNSLDSEKLLAIVIYKNLMPSDFINLHNSKKEGIVYSIFNDNDSIQKVKLSISKEINDKIEKLKNDLESINYTEINNLFELRRIYLYQLIETNPFIISLHLNGVDISFEEAKLDDNFDKIYNDPKLTFNTYSPTYSRIQKSNVFINLKTIKINSQDYEEREKIVKLKIENKRNSLRHEISYLNRQKDEIYNRPIKELNLEKTNTIFERIKEYPLITEFIIEGYIAEDYNFYISIIREGKLTYSDYEFIIGIKNGVVFDRKYKLIKIEYIVKPLFPSDFEKASILNVDLIDFILSKENDFKLQISKVYNLLKVDYYTTFDFVQHYSKIGKEKAQFFEGLCSNWEDIWIVIEQELSLSELEIDEILFSLIDNLSLNTLGLINKDKLLSSFISEKESFTSEYYNFKVNSKVRDLIKLLNIKFKCIEPSENEELEKFIYENNYYEINEGMISFFIRKYSKNINENIPLASYTNILNMENDSMFYYVNDYIDDYISNVFLQNKVMQEDENNLICFLNNVDISIENKNNIVLTKEISIKNLGEIEDIYFKELLIKENKCKPNWKNICHYVILKEYNIDDNLLKYLQIESNFKALSEDLISRNELNDLDSTNNISLLFIKENRLEFKSYSYLMKSVLRDYDAIKLDNLGDEKIFVLIDYKIISLTNENLVNLYPKKKAFIELIRNNKKEFLFKYNDLELNDSMLQIIFESEIFTQTQYQKIINATDFKIIESAKLADSFCNTIIEKEIPLSKEELIKLLTLSTRSSNKIIILNRYFELNSDSISKSQILDNLNLLGGDYAKIAIKKRPTFVKNDEHVKLLNFLEEKEIISSYKHQSRGLRIYHFG